LYEAGRAVTTEFLQRVERTMGQVTWDTIFAARHLQPLSPQGDQGELHMAQPWGPTAGRALDDPVSVPPEVKYFIYEKITSAPG
jgi:hypothetical protein